MSTLVFATACSSEGTTSPQTSAHTTDTPLSSPARTSSRLPRIRLPVSKGKTVEGLVDVDGHDIYARCSGRETPTVVYFTGWAPDASKRGVDVIRAVERVDAGKHRICSYERRN